MSLAKKKKKKAQKTVTLVWGLALIVMGSVDERAVAREVNISFPALCFPQLFLIRDIYHNCSPVACQTCPPHLPLQFPLKPQLFHPDLKVFLRLFTAEARSGREECKYGAGEKLTAQLAFRCRNPLPSCPHSLPPTPPHTQKKKEKKIHRH